MESADEVGSPGVETSWLELSTCLSPMVNGLLAIMRKTKGPVLVLGSSSSCPCWLNLSIFSLGETVGMGRWVQHFSPASLSSLRDADSSRGQRVMGPLMPHPTFYARDAQEMNTSSPRAQIWLKRLQARGKQASGWKWKISFLDITKDLGLTPVRVGGAPLCWSEPEGLTG